MGDFMGDFGDFSWIVFEWRFEEFCVGEGARPRRDCEGFNNMTRYPPMVYYTVRIIGINRLFHFFNNRYFDYQSRLLVFNKLIGFIV